MFGPRFLAVLLTAFAFSQSSRAEQLSLSSAWNGLRSSWFGSEMRFSCGGDNYRIIKDFKGTLKISWLNQSSDWSEVKLQKTSDEAVTIHGLGIDAEKLTDYVQYQKTEQAKEDATLPGSHKSPVSMNVKAFKVKENRQIPFEYVVNFFDEEMKGANLEGFNVKPVVTYNHRDLVELPDMWVAPGTIKRNQKCALRT
jgi:hypothetical protein